MNREEFAISLGYKSDAEREAKLADPEYQKELRTKGSIMARAYALGSAAYDGRWEDYKKILNDITQRIKIK